MPKSRMTQVRSLLWKMLHFQRKRHHTAAAHRIHTAIEALQDKPEVKPTRILYPGVAAARAQSQNGGLPGDPSAPNPGAGWCLLFVRLCFGIPAGTRRAIDAWNNAVRKHRTSDPMSIPRGYPVFFAPNHIAISAGGGECWSTDVRRDGFFDKVGIAELCQMWGLTLLGWTEDLNGEPVKAEEKL